MTWKHFSYGLLAVAAIIMSACNNEDKTAEAETSSAETKAPKIREDNISYTGDNITMNGFVAYDENKDGPRPGVIVIPEWWGLNDYPKRRAKQLAELGYIAIAVDMYGDGKIADNPDSAGKYATPFYQDPQMAKRRFDAALARLKSFSQTDTSKIAAIGYCFGGAQVLNMARLGEDLKGVVSFHGNLTGVPADKSTLKAAILVCHGAADPFVPAPEVEKFKKEMEAVGADYTFKAYDNATHAFTNPEATEIGQKFKMPIAYNAVADSSSWQEMKTFFEKIFR